MRALFLAVILSVIATPMHAQSLKVTGYVGYLGEWELTAEVAGRASAGTTEYSGPFTLKHVGLCSQDGPEEKTGEMRFRLSASSSRIKATLLVDGVECSYSGKLSDSYFGTMSCPDRGGVPLTLWLKAAEKTTDAAPARRYDADVAAFAGGANTIPAR